jgi:hypothetical protein
LEAASSQAFDGRRSSLVGAYRGEAPKRGEFICNAEGAPHEDSEETSAAVRHDSYASRQRRRTETTGLRSVVSPMTRQAPLARLLVRVAKVWELAE